MAIAYDLVLEDRILARQGVKKRQRSFARELAEMVRYAVGYRSRAFVTFGDADCRVRLRPPVAARRARPGIPHARRHRPAVQGAPTALVAAAMRPSIGRARARGRNRPPARPDCASDRRNLGVTSGRQAVDEAAGPLEKPRRHRRRERPVPRARPPGAALLRPHDRPPVRPGAVGEEQRGCRTRIGLRCPPRISTACGRSPRLSAWPAAARSSSAAGCATGCSAARRRTSTSRSSASRPRRFGRCSSRSAASRRSARASPSTRSASIDVALPRRESKVGRGHRGLRRRGRPRDVGRGRLAPARLHHQRHLVGSAVGRVPRPARRMRRPRGPRPPRRRPGDVRRRQPARPARGAVRRAVRAAALPDDRRDLCRAIPLDDLPAERIWGEFEKLLLLARAPVARVRPRARGWASSRACCPKWRRSSGARRSRSGTRKATCGCTR